jgi:parallel beta-helix repeat protein
MRTRRRNFLKLLAGLPIFISSLACGLSKSADDGEEAGARSASSARAGITMSNQSYYVDINRGNDRGNGSQAAPWKSLGKASQKVRAGDTLTVLAGDYRSEGNIVIEQQGVESAPITITADSQGEVIVTSFLIRNCQWITIRGFRIIGPKSLPQPWLEMPEIVIDDPSVGLIDPTSDWDSGRERLVSRKYATYMAMLNDRIDKWTSGISVRSSDYIVVRDNEISDHTAGVHAIDETSVLSVENNRLHHLLSGVYTARARNARYSVKDSLIANNHIFQSLGVGIRLLNKADNNVVEHNVVEYSGIGHIDTHSESAQNVIRFNQVRYGGYYTETMENPGSSAISIHSSGSGNRVEGNDVSYQVDVTGRDGNGIIVDYTTVGALIANNVIYRNMGNGVSSTHSGNNTIIHNTIVENGYNSSVKWQGVGIGMAQKEDINNVIANNILANNSQGGMYFNGLLNRQKYVDYNLIQSSDQAPLVSDTHDEQQSFYTLSQMQGRGIGSNTLVAGVNFVAGDQGDFQLNSGSTAIDAGTTEYTIDYDKDNQPRPHGGAPDIGAFEYLP